MGTHLRVLDESFPMNTKMIGFRWFSKILEFLCHIDKSNLSIERVKQKHYWDNTWRRNINKGIYNKLSNKYIVKLTSIDKQAFTDSPI